MDENQIAQLQYLYGEQPDDGFGLDTSIPAPMGWYPSQPVDLMGASDQVNPQITSQKIQELLGAKQPDPGGIAQDILSSRFGGGGVGLEDYASGFAQSSFGKPTLGADVASSRMNEQLKQMQALQAIDTGAAHAELYRKGGTGTNGATIQMANAIMAANNADPTKPPMNMAQAIYAAQTGFRTGTVMNPDQSLAMMPGKTNVLKDTSRATTAGGNEADVVTNAQADLPTIIDNAQTSINVINEALNHPGLNANFGMTGMVPNRPGSPASDASALLEQIKGGGFLTAYGQLRGGGQISNIEGEKATSAYVRMQKAQSAEAFRQAAKEYIGIIQKGVNRAKNKASGAVFNQGTSAPTSAIQLDESDPRIQKARAAGYTDEEIAAHLQGGQ